VVASLALFAALGGSSYAAISLPAGSVGTKQLHKRAVTGAKIKKNAITGGKVKDGSLLKQDFAAGQLPAGPRGEKGETGAAGAAGAAGTARAYGWVSKTGALDTGVSKNVASVTHPFVGVYCIAPTAGLGIAPTSTVVVADIDAASYNGSITQARRPAANCPAGRFEVDTFQGSVSGTGILNSYKDNPFSFVIP
jgi:hypothetical protein